MLSGTVEELPFLETSCLFGLEFGEVTEILRGIVVMAILG